MSAWEMVKFALFCFGVSAVCSFGASFLVCRMLMS